MARRLSSSLVAAVLLGLAGGSPLRAQVAGPTMSAPANQTPIVDAPTVNESPAAVLPPLLQEAVPSEAPTAWWDEAVRRALIDDGSPLGLDLDATVSGVLMYSPLVRIAADVPVIRETQIADAAARFDPRVFIDSKFTDTSDPVGNLLTTGGANRFIDQTSINSAGIRKTNTTGGQFEAAQRMGYQNNNSIFFIPKDQGTSRITLTYTQPLLNGAGKMYNTSVVYLAELNTQAAMAQLQRELQTILLDAHKMYWELYLRRAALLQRQRLKQQAVDIQRELRARADFDVLKSQIVRADAAVATRDAAVIRFTTEIANTETRLRALINDPALSQPPHELIPIAPPQRALAEPSLADALATALQQRPEIQAGFTEVRAASVRADVSKNELLPELNWLMGTYVAGLQGNSQFGQAWVDQFSVGRPTYWTGLQFEYPLYNRAPRARQTQRLVELRQATNKLQETMIRVRAETETAVREVVTTYREMLSKYEAMQADQTEIDYLTSRWRLLAGDQQLAGVMLNDLLSAHERLADAEFDFAAAEAAYNVALVNLNVVTGTLLQAQRVEILNASMEGVPMLDVRAEPRSAYRGYQSEPTTTPTIAPEPVPHVAPTVIEATPPTPPVPQRTARLLAPILNPEPVVATPTPTPTPSFTPLPTPPDAPVPVVAERPGFDRIVPLPLPEERTDSTGP
jgi:outer membrane protein TolC